MLCRMDIAIWENGKKVLIMAKEYIERKAIYDKLEKEKEYAKELWELESNASTIEKDMRWGIYCGFSHAIRMVNSIPAADVEEVRHGRWVKWAVDIPERPYHCSSCGWSNHHIPDSVVVLLERCPHCGAYMMGESNGKCE